MRDLRWVQLTYRRHALVDASDKILAMVYNHFRTVEFNGHEFLTLEAARRAAEESAQTEISRERPSAVYRPNLSIDGNKWCALYGNNLQDGVAGFGDSPAEAMADFDQNWHTTLEKRI